MKIVPQYFSFGTPVTGDHVPAPMSGYVLSEKLRCDLSVSGRVLFVIELMLSDLHVGI
jgi:hypothetical protein